MRRHSALSRGLDLTLCVCVRVIVAFCPKRPRADDVILQSSDYKIFHSDASHTSEQLQCARVRNTTVKSEQRQTQ
jgi:hypothetical protein